MKITLTKIKHNEHFSDETDLFCATICVDRKPVLLVENDGHGTPNKYDSIDGTINVESMLNFINAWCVIFLPKIKMPWDNLDGSECWLQPDLDWHIQDLLNAWKRKKYKTK